MAEAIQANPSLRANPFLYGEMASAGKRPKWNSCQPQGWLHRLRGVTEFPNILFIIAQLFLHGHRFDESYSICADHKFLQSMNFSATASICRS